MKLLDLFLSMAALPALGASAYLAGLALAARRSAAPASPAPRLRFDLIVPAHNEENDIAETVTSLLAVDYPRACYRVIVVADNCTDGTGPRATAAGAQVLVRQNAEERGKGYALAYAFGRSLDDHFADVIVVVDADTLVSANMLSAFAARFEAGASVVQADYGVRNPRSSWRTRMMTIALGAFHGVRSLARERLGLSCGLRGNGMGFATAVLVAHPPKAFSIVEDLEYGIQLGYAGVRVEYVHDVQVRGHMAVSEHDSRSQRQRWERGRQALVRLHVPRLLVEALRRRDACLLDLALDLIVPPLGQLVLATGLGLTISFAASRFGIVIAPWLWAAALFGIGIHVLQGWRVSGVGFRGLLDLLWAPVYIAWKLTLRLRDKGRGAAGVGSHQTRGAPVKPVHVPDSEWQRIWFSIRQHSWSSLALVPSDPAMNVLEVASSLVETGRLQGERPLNLIDATGVQMPSVQQMVASLAALAEHGESAIVAVGPVAENPTAVAIIQAASAALLVVRLGDSLMGSAQKTLDVVGRSRFIGSIVIDSSSRVSLR